MSQLQCAWHSCTIALELLSADDAPVGFDNLDCLAEPLRFVGALAFMYQSSRRASFETKLLYRSA